MKLRKQTGLKASIVALAGGLFLAFLGLIHANPGISSEASAAPAATPVPTTDPYRGFFGGNRQGFTDPQVLPPSTSSTPSATTPRTHTRSHAS